MGWFKKLGNKMIGNNIKTTVAKSGMSEADKRSAVVSLTKKINSSAVSAKISKLDKQAKVVTVAAGVAGAVVAAPIIGAALAGKTAVVGGVAGAGGVVKASLPSSAMKSAVKIASIPVKTGADFLKDTGVVSPDLKKILSTSVPSPFKNTGVAGGGLDLTKVITEANKVVDGFQKTVDKGQDLVDDTLSKLGIKKEETVAQIVERKKNKKTVAASFLSGDLLMMAGAVVLFFFVVGSMSGNATRK